LSAREVERTVVRHPPWHRDDPAALAACRQLAGFGEDDARREYLDEWLDGNFTTDAQWLPGQFTAAS